MELSDRVVVVTGGGSGIGRGLALRMAEEGAKGVLVADLNGESAEAVAAEIGAQGRGVGADVTDEAAVAGLLRTAEEAWGPVDVFCANAGIGVGHSLENTSTEEWERVMDVNVRAHVIAARLLVPGWLERGEGYFLSTASAAGLLTQVGDVSYSVSKAGAVAFAEWLSITYGERGVRVSCLCPMGVDTPLLRGGLAQAGDDSLGVRVVEVAGTILQPEEVADAVVETMRAETFLVTPHPEVREFLRRKGDDPDRWIAGMRRLQGRVVGSS